MGAGGNPQDINQITERIIGCAFAVSNALGVGFPGKVYENALAHVLRKAGLKAGQQAAIRVRYDGVVGGEYDADLLVPEQVIVELKVAKSLDDMHLAQCLNYLKPTGLEVCLLLNFGKPKVEIKRVIRNQ